MTAGGKTVWAELTCENAERDITRCPDEPPADRSAPAVRPARRTWTAGMSCWTVEREANGLSGVAVSAALEGD